MLRYCLLALLALLACTTGAFAQTYTYWAGTPGTEIDWSTPSAWTSGEPTVSKYAHIDNGGTVLITALGELSNTTMLGSTTGSSGFLHILSGSLGCTSSLGIGVYGTGTVTQDGGIVSATGVLGSIYLGSSGGTGTYTLNDGNVNATQMAIYSGSSFIQNGGRVTVGPAISHFKVALTASGVTLVRLVQ